MTKLWLILFFARKWLLKIRNRLWCHATSQEFKFPTSSRPKVQKLLPISDHIKYAMFINLFLLLLVIDVITN